MVIRLLGVQDADQLANDVGAVTIRPNNLASGTVQTTNIFTFAIDDERLKRSKW